MPWSVRHLALLCCCASGYPDAASFSVTAASAAHCGGSSGIPADGRCVPAEVGPALIQSAQRRPSGVVDASVPAAEFQTSTFWPQAEGSLMAWINASDVAAVLEQSRQRLAHAAVQVTEMGTSALVVLSADKTRKPLRFPDALDWILTRGHALWLLTCLIGALVVAWAWQSGGGSLVRKAVPVSTAVSICVGMSLASSHMGEPYSHFSAVTALVTVVFVMEMGTLERFIVKCTLRSLGTVLGVCMAVCGAEASDLTGHHSAVIVGFCFCVFLVNAVLAKQFVPYAAAFSFASVTYALIFFGYLRQGWPAVWERFVSVIIGELTAFLVIIFFDFVCWDLCSTLCISLLVTKAEQIFDHTLAMVDFAFARNEIAAFKIGDGETDSLSGFEDRDLHKVLAAWLQLNGHPSKPDLQERMRQSAHFCDSMDSAVSGMQAECRSCWSDMSFTRSIMPAVLHKFIGNTPDYGVLPEKVHPVYVQVSALAHATHVEPQRWASEGPRLEALRLNFRALDQPFKELFKQQAKDVASRCDPPDAPRVAEIIRHGTAAVEALERARVMMQELKTAKEGGASMGFWRFDTFVQTLSVVVADASFLLLLIITLMKVPEEKAEDLFARLLDLANVEEKSLEGTVSVALANSKRRRHQHQSDDARDDGGGDDGE